MILQITPFSSLQEVLWSSFSALETHEYGEECSITEKLYDYYRGPKDVLTRPCNKIMLMLCIAYTRGFIELLPRIPKNKFMSDYMMFNAFEKDEQLSYYRHFRKGMEFAVKNIEMSENNQRNYFKYMITRQNPFNFNPIDYQFRFCCKLYIMQPLSMRLLHRVDENSESRSLIDELKHMCEEALKYCNTQKESTSHRAYTDAVHKTIAMLSFITEGTQQLHNDPHLSRYI